MALIGGLMIQLFLFAEVQADCVFFLWSFMGCIKDKLLHKIAVLTDQENETNWSMGKRVEQS